MDERALREVAIEIVLRELREHRDMVDRTIKEIERVPKGPDQLRDYVAALLKGPDTLAEIRRQLDGSCQ